MLILGVDPGTATTGYGVVKLSEPDFEIVGYGLIETDKDNYAPSRYAKIYSELIELIYHHKPDVMVIERIFFASNARTAISVGQAQGVMYLAAHKCGLNIIEYAPPTIKKVLTGNGRAKKKEVEANVRELLGKNEKVLKIDKARRITKTHMDNAVDALAIAICHILHLNDQTLKRPSVVYSNGKL